MTKKVAIVGGTLISRMAEGEKFYRDLHGLYTSDKDRIVILDSMSQLDNLAISLKKVCQEIKLPPVVDSLEMEQLDQRRMVKTDRNNLSYYPKSHRKFPVKR
ncbi:hypothetical protein [Ewingella americana]|uniref:Uncharacterized protein n=1 Tax=Ewingella americana TaxID=41202 RepID=A0A502GED1_9GAMM|nr:hypothetical protein [Ewingella americana]TPG59982.1 hypothetical protein EAH77_15560 [Ewingella americana]